MKNTYYRSYHYLIGQAGCATSHTCRDVRLITSPSTYIHCISLEVIRVRHYFEVRHSSKSSYKEFQVGSSSPFSTDFHFERCDKWLPTLPIARKPPPTHPLSFINLPASGNRPHRLFQDEAIPYLVSGPLFTVVFSPVFTPSCT